MKLTSLQSYPDQLLKETFVHYSEKALSQKHDDVLSVPRGFQEFLNSDSSNDRSRAVELFDIGLLRGQLVSSREGARASMPLGWSIIQSDDHVHTRLGYCAYAIGKAMRSPVSSRYPYIKKAFSILCTIFLLQTGFEFDGRYILTASVFRYLQREFRPQHITNTQNIWARKLATAMFSTLDHDEKREELLTAYISGSSIDHLYLQNSIGQTTRITPDNLHNDQINLNSVYPLKLSLFFVGTGDEPRGLYTKAVEDGERLLKAAEHIERDSIIRHAQNPFASSIEKPRESEVRCVLEILEGIYSSAGVREEWTSAMKTLSQGTIDAIKFIEGDRTHAETRTFFMHDPQTPIPAFDEVIFEVPPDDCYLIPVENDKLIYESNAFLVLSVDTSDDLVKIRTRRIVAE